MKKLTTIIIAIALFLGMSQCKKNVETITPSNQGKTVHITVNVSDGGKHIVYPGTGAYVFENGDKLYVGNNGKYRGTLTYNSGAFSGTIYSPSTNDYLHFYFVGGLTPSATPSAGSTASFTVSIANQSSKLPVLSYAHSTQKYVDGTTTYGCTLLNKCGLVKFTLTNGSSETVKVTGMKTGVTVNFANPEKAIVTNGTYDAITLRNEGTDSERWAILLPQDAVIGGIAKIGESFYSCNVEAVAENSYITSNLINNSAPITEPLFTVSPNGNFVRFSKGNLQYLGTGTSGKETPKWRFADNQWDYMGNGPTSGTVNQGNVAIEGYSAYNTGSNDATPTDADKAAARDLFGWGTSGGGTPATPPYMTVNNNGSIYGGTSNIAGTDRDWGVYNKAVIENNDGKNWRTLTSTQWVNLFNRTKTIAGSSQKLYGFAIVMGVRGIVVLPDNWDGSVDGDFTYAGTLFANNRYTANSTVTWAEMESAGAVFLPAAGSRSGSSVSDADFDGFYWSSSFVSGSDKAYTVYFYSGSFTPATNYSRYRGYSVRLVFDN